MKSDLSIPVLTKENTLNPRNRPHDVLVGINVYYQMLSAPQTPGTVFKGEPEDLPSTYMAHGLYTNSRDFFNERRRQFKRELLKAKEAQQQETKQMPFEAFDLLSPHPTKPPCLEAVDYGAGEGFEVAELNKLKRVHVRGITPRRVRKQKDPNIVLGNAEYFLDYFEENSLDIIFSSGVFEDVTDPAGDLVDIYRAAKVGAWIVVDAFSLGLIDIDHRQLIKYLIDRGYEIGALFNSLWADKFEILIIRKTAKLPHLELPLRYVDKLSEHCRAQYVFTDKLQATADEDTASEIKKTHEKLSALFKDEKYQKKGWLEQANAIKTLVKPLSRAAEKTCISTLSGEAANKYCDAMANSFSHHKLAELTYSLEGDWDILKLEERYNLIIALAAEEIQIERDKKLFLDFCRDIEFPIQRSPGRWNILYESRESVYYRDTRLEINPLKAPLTLTLDADSESKESPDRELLSPQRTGFWKQIPKKAKDNGSKKLLAFSPTP